MEAEAPRLLSRLIFKITKVRTFTMTMRPMVSLLMHGALNVQAEVLVV